MTDQQHGRLYRSARAEHPDAILALSRPVQPQRELPVELPARPRERQGWSAGLVYALVLGGTTILGVADRYITGQLGLITSVGFVALSLLAAWLATPAAAWASWTAPPLGFALVALVYANIAPNSGEGFLFREVFSVMLTLASHAWPVVATTLVCWLIARRAMLRGGMPRRRRRDSESTDF